MKQNIQFLHFHWIGKQTYVIFTVCDEKRIKMSWVTGMNNFAISNFICTLVVHHYYQYSYMLACSLCWYAESFENTHKGMKAVDGRR